MTPNLLVPVEVFEAFVSGVICLCTPTWSTT